MARILDFYAVRWDYEPRTFPILWNLEGDVVESFSPDFYLPDLDLFLEMTTLKQRLVRKKNRKLRRLRELYPDIRIKLFYARDFRAMMLKYGRLALADSLSGTLGQVMPDRSRDDGLEIEPMIVDEAGLPITLLEAARAPIDPPGEAPGSGAATEAALHGPIGPATRADTGTGTGTGTGTESPRRNASRSRRRRAAAAARRASRSGDANASTAAGTSHQDEEDRSRR